MLIKAKDYKNLFSENGKNSEKNKNINSLINLVRTIIKK